MTDDLDYSDEDAYYAELGLDVGDADPDDEDEDESEGAQSWKEVPWWDRGF